MDISIMIISYIPVTFFGFLPLKNSATYRVQPRRCFSFLVKSRHADPLLVGFSLTLGGCGEVDAIFQLKNGWFNMV